MTIPSPSFDTEAEISKWCRGLWETGASVRRVGIELKVFGRQVPLITVTRWLEQSGIERQQLLREEAPRQFHEDAFDDLTALAELPGQIRELRERANLPDAPKNIRVAIRAAVHEKHLLMWKLSLSGLLPSVSKAQKKAAEPQPTEAQKRQMEELRKIADQMFEVSKQVLPVGEPKEPAVTVPVTNAVTVPVTNGVTKPVVTNAVTVPVTNGVTKPAVTVPVTVASPARNAKCACGSTKKYKKCCGDPKRAKPQADGPRAA